MAYPTDNPMDGRGRQNATASLQITVTPTLDCVLLSGIRARIWEGVTSGGAACRLAVPLVEVPPGQDFSEFEAALLALDAPLRGPLLHETKGIEASLPAPLQNVGAAVDTALRCAAFDLMLAALRSAEQFIVNGVAFGFIRMPDAGSPDAAHLTLPTIRAAIAQAEGR